MPVGTTAAIGDGATTNTTTLHLNAEKTLTIVGYQIVALVFTERL
jgi:hypothetical protein